MHSHKYAVREDLILILCRIIDCPPLITPKLVSLSTRTSAFGTKVTVSCPRGYEFVTGRGQMFDVTCELGGKWTESRIPDCQRKTTALLI